MTDTAPILPSPGAIVGPLRDALAAKGYELSQVGLEWMQASDSPDAWDIALTFAVRDHTRINGYGDPTWLGDAFASANSVADLLAHIAALPPNPHGIPARAEMEDR